MKKKAMKHKKGTFKMQGPDGRVHELDNSHRDHVQHLIDNGGDVEGYVMKCGGKVRKAALGDEVANQQEQNASQSNTGLLTAPNANAPLQQEGNFTVQAMGSDPNMSTNLPLSMGPRVRETPLDNMQSMGQSSITPIGGMKSNLDLLGPINTTGTTKPRTRSKLPYTGDYYVDRGIQFGGQLHDAQIARNTATTPGQYHAADVRAGGANAGIAGAVIGKTMESAKTIGGFLSKTNADITALNTENGLRADALRDSAPINPFRSDEAGTTYGTRGPMSKFGGKIKMALGGKLGYIAENGTDFLSNTPNVEVEGGGKGKQGEVLAETGAKTGIPTVTNFNGHDTHDGSNPPQIEAGVGSAVLPIRLGDTVEGFKKRFEDHPEITDAINNKWKDDGKKISWANVGDLFNTKPESKELEKIGIAIKKDTKKLGVNSENAENDNFTRVDKKTAELNTKTLGRNIQQFQQEGEQVKQVMAAKTDLVANVIYPELEQAKKNEEYGSKIAKETKGSGKNGIRIKLPKAGNGWKDEWTQRILAHERKAGAPGGVGFKKGYDDADFMGDNTSKFQKYIDDVKAEVPNFDSLPSSVKTRLVDYKFNTGRKISDLVHLATGFADIDKVNDPKINLGSLSKEELAQLSKSEFTSKIDQAKESIYRTTHKDAPEFQGNLDKNWLPRTRMWEDMDPTKGALEVPSNAQLPVQGGSQGVNPLSNGQYSAPSLGGGRNTVNAQGELTYDPSDITHFRTGVLYPGDKYGSKHADQQPFGAYPGWNAAPGLGQPKEVMDQLARAGFTPKNGWNNVSPEEVQDFLIDKDKNNTTAPYSVMRSLYGKFANTEQGRAWAKENGLPEGATFDELGPKGIEAFFKDKKYGIRTGLAAEVLSSWNPKKDPTPTNMDYTNADVEKFTVKGQAQNPNKRGIFQEALNPNQYAANMMDLLTPIQAVPYIEDHGAKDALAASTKQRYTDIQPQLNRLRRGTLAQTRNRQEPSLNAQAYANEYEAANQVYGQKYNADAQIEQNYNNMQNELRMKAGANKAQALDTLAQRTATRDWKATAMFRNAVGEIGNKEAQQATENRASALYQDMFQNYGYNPYDPNGPTTYQGNWTPQVGLSHIDPLTRLSENGKYEVGETIKADGTKEYTRRLKTATPSSKKFGGKVKLPKKMPKKR